METDILQNTAAKNRMKFKTKLEVICAFYGHKETIEQHVSLMDLDQPAWRQGPSKYSINVTTAVEFFLENSTIDGEPRPIISIGSCRKSNLHGFFDPIPPSLKELDGYETSTLCLIYKCNGQDRIDYFGDDEKVDVWRRISADNKGKVT